ncbi:MAG: response regulator transcription factor [Treponema sp.]|nr:response regulator transcription factor [Treponema sp.]
MFRIAICEDEKNILDYENSIVKQWADKRSMSRNVELDSYVSAENFLFEIEDKESYDVLIFDIQMKNMNGMELARKLRARGCDSVIIFITGVPDYAIEGYEVGAVRYILKPVKPEVLYSLLDAAFEERQKKTEDYFVLGQGADLERIAFDRILYIEARGHYVYMKGMDFEREWKSSFSDASVAFDGKNFFCLRRGLLVNLCHVSRITRTDCILDNEESLPVARGVYKDLNDAFIKFFRGESC